MKALVLSLWLTERDLHRLSQLAKCQPSSQLNGVEGLEALKGQVDMSDALKQDIFWHCLTPWQRLGYRATLTVIYLTYFIAVMALTAGFVYWQWRTAIN